MLLTVVCVYVCVAWLCIQKLVESKMSIKPSLRPNQIFLNPIYAYYGFPPVASATTISLSISLSLSRSHSLPLSLSLTHTHTLACAPSYYTCFEG